MEASSHGHDSGYGEYENEAHDLSDDYAYGEEYDKLENREKLDEGGFHLGRKADEGTVQEKMSAWYAKYSARTAGIKRHMKPIAALYEKEGLMVRDGTAEACGNLAAEARKALADPEVWATPDRDIGDELKSVYGLIADLGDACQIGQDPRARELIRKIELPAGLFGDVLPHELERYRRRGSTG